MEGPLKNNLFNVWEDGEIFPLNSYGDARVDRGRPTRNVTSEREELTNMLAMAEEACYAEAKLEILLDSIEKYSSEKQQ